ncbi:low-specificity L-threonine aldolase [Nitrospinaceae bacterium]|nr:low-specificity L-threonine aldolase [Nitrospinaceae bacterium]
MIDLRSDTLTNPTQSMRDAMATAEVGDDVFQEDPTVQKLETLSAKIMGKEAALFVPSGCMGNLISILSHCGRGDEILLGDRSHISLYEVGGVAALGGVHPRPLPNNNDGTISIDLLEKGIRHSDIHCPPTRLICLENTHNFCQGSPITPEYMTEVRKIANKFGLKIHLDGARIFNAAVALGVPVAKLTEKVDSVMFCLSKGLSAPVGSLVCGSSEFIVKARKARKMVGGGMRQVGHIAAAGLIAITEQVDRLQEDHDNAKFLASQLSDLDGIEVDVTRIKTNIIFFKLTGIDGEVLLNQLEQNQIKILMTDADVFRAVLHREVSKEQVQTVVKTFQSILGKQ